ncbi:MAG: hypothetical protein JSW49_00785 [candidate division WOR-3 bacterium]|nr:MAG: hypothetical protein JSW49_00785 [candidate division WOR-3 bacterium]
MVISPDGTKAFVCVPKTGTNTVHDILIRFCGAREVYPLERADQDAFNWGNYLESFHKTVEQNLGNIRITFPNATVASITAYGFLRDPIERWCSAVDFYYKRQPWFLLRLRTVAGNKKKRDFLDGVVHRLHADQYKLPSYAGRPEKVNHEALAALKEFYSPEVVQEMASVPWEDFPIDIDEAGFFHPQSRWLKQPNTVILDYSKFNEELEWLVNQEWQGKLYYTNFNMTYKNTSEVPKLPVSKSLRKKLMDTYSEDYDLTPHTIL